MKTKLVEFLFSGLTSTAILVSSPDLNVLWDVLISFAVSFVTILGSKLITYLSKWFDNKIDLNKNFTEDNDSDVVQEKKEKSKE